MCTPLRLNRCSCCTLAFVCSLLGDMLRRVSGPLLGQPSTSPGIPFRGRCLPQKPTQKINVLCDCSPLGNMLARVSGLLLGQASTPAPPPLPPKPWLADQHRSIDEHFFSEPGPLGLKVHAHNFANAS